MNKLNEFTGTEKPSWRPQKMIEPGEKPDRRKNYLHPVGLPDRVTEFFLTVDRFLSTSSCHQLIAEFEKQIVHPVGVDGYNESSSPDKIGSYRANAWSETLAAGITQALHGHISNDSRFARMNSAGESYRNLDGEEIRLPVSSENLSYLGVTPFFRFMKYPGGGRHVPHYDAPFTCETHRYITLLSCVIYLNTPEGHGGRFQFVDDQQYGLTPGQRNKSDWKRMADEKEILASVEPVEGRLLVFPHWLPHQVELYQNTGPSYRYIIRGDVAYEW